MDNCGKLVAGGPCMRTPGHGGGCFSGHIVPVDNPESYLPTTPGTLFEISGAWGAMYGRPWFWRYFLRFARNREVIRFALLGVMALAQLWIDVFLIILWAK